MMASIRASRMGSVAGLQITQISMSARVDKFMTVGDQWPTIIPSGLYEIDLHGVTSDKRVMDTFYGLTTNPLTALYAADQEFMCMYCASPNPITHRHCSKCGAPRGFLIGQTSGG